MAQLCRRVRPQTNIYSSSGGQQSTAFLVGEGFGLSRMEVHPIRLQSSVLAKDPFPKRVVVAQSTSDTKPEVSGISVDEARANAAIASVAMNQASVRLRHLPCLLHEFMEPSASHDLGGMESVKVYFHPVLQVLDLPIKASSIPASNTPTQPASVSRHNRLQRFPDQSVIDRFLHPLLATR